MSLNFKGIRYRIQRIFGLTDYDREVRRQKQLKTDLSMQEGIIASLNIAPLSDLPVPISAAVAGLVYFLLACAMVFFVAQGFVSARNEKFLALSHSAGLCETVPKTVSGVYKLDINGFWEGSEDFQVSKSIYEVTLNRIEFTDAQFASLIELALQQLNYYGSSTATWTLAENLVFWMSWSINTVASANRQNLRLTGDAKTVFNQGSMHLSGMSSLGGRCDVSSSLTFEKASGVYRITYSYLEFSRSEACMRAADPRSLGFRPGLGTDAFSLEFDMQSVMTVMGVNYGLIDFDVLQEVPFTRGVLQLGGESQAYANYYNPRYPNMNVITCFAKFNSSAEDFGHDRVSICAIEIGITPILPVFNHIGYESEGLNGSLYCHCGEEIMSDVALSSQCNQFMMMTGFIFYYSDFDHQPAGPPLALEYFAQLNKKYDGDEQKRALNRDAYNISKDAIHFAQDGYFDSPDRLAAYDFCTVAADTPCSVLTIFTAGENNHHAVSEDYYQVPRGHCNDTATLSPLSQAKMAVPPVPLTENYLECRRTLADTLLTSVGIAVGNVLSIKSGLVLLFTFWLARYTRSGGTSRAQYVTYGAVERDKVLQYLAFNLLLARDGKCPSPAEEGSVREAGPRRESSLVAGLASELQAQPALNRFFLADNGLVSEGAGPARNPILPGEGEGGVGGDIELQGSRCASSHSAQRPATVLRRRGESAFEDEVLHNPMFLSEVEQQQQQHTRDRQSGRRRMQKQ